MKIRNLHLLRLAGGLASLACRGLVRSLRFHYKQLGDISVNPADHDASRKTIISLWHEHLMLPAARYGGPDKAALVSEHADGQLLSSLLKSKGMGLIFGSTNRGGVLALRQMTDPNTPWQHLVVTPDGPRGPRRVVQPGILFVAAKTGIPVIPLGIGLSRCWRTKSWDRFCVPKPFGRGILISGESIFVPPEAKKDGLEPYRLMVQNEMDRLTRIAQDWAVTGSEPAAELLKLPVDMPFRLAS